MGSEWKEVIGRKDYCCLCCNIIIPKGEKHFVVTEWWGGGRYPQVTRYCSKCGVHVKAGLSYRQARLKAYGTPILQRWRRP